MPRPYHAKSVATVAIEYITVASSQGARRMAPMPVGWSSRCPWTCSSAVWSMPYVASMRAASSGRPWARSQVGDSGRKTTQSGKRTRTAAEATAYIGRHPAAGMTEVPMSAAAVPPMGTPDIMIVETAERVLALTNSAVRALADGTRPPRPRPAKKRSRPKISRLGAK